MESESSPKEKAENSDLLVEFIVSAQYKIPRIMILQKDNVIPNPLLHEKKGQFPFVVQIS